MLYLLGCWNCLCIVLKTSFPHLAKGKQRHTVEEYYFKVYCIFSYCFCSQFKDVFDSIKLTCEQETESASSWQEVVSNKFSKGF